MSDFIINERLTRGKLYGYDMKVTEGKHSKAKLEVNVF